MDTITVVVNQPVDDLREGIPWVPVGRAYTSERSSPPQASTLRRATV
jgi:hypothetical protein